MFNKSLDTILNQFNKVVTELDTFLDVTNQDIVNKEAKVSSLEGEISQLKSSVDRANSVKTKIFDLIY